VKNLLKYFISAFIFSLCSSPIQAALSTLQSSDSLESILDNHPQKDSMYVELLIQLAKTKRNENVTESKEYFDEAIELSEQLQIPVLKIRGLNGIGINYAIQDQYTESIKAFEKALSIALELNYQEHAADSYNSLGIVYKMLGEYPLSLNHHSKALEIYKELDIEGGIASCYSNMGVLFDLMDEPQKAMQHYQAGLIIEQKSGNKYKIAIINSNIGLLYVKQKEYQKAIAVFRSSLDYFKHNDKKVDHARDLLNLGEVYYKLNQYDSAAFYFNEILDISKSNGFFEIQVSCLLSFAKLQADKGDYVQSISMAMEAKELAERVKSWSLSSRTEHVLSYIFEKAGNFEKSLFHFKQHTVYEDSLFNESKLKAYKTQQVLMEVNAKNEQIKAQSQQLSFLDQQVALENRWKWTMALFCLLLFVTVAMLYHKYKSRKIHIKELSKRNDLIVHQKEEIDKINTELNREILLREETDNTINYFATSLFGKNSVEEILWDIAKNCISRLGLVDCVIYLLDDSGKVLVQKAAYGTKNPEDFEIHEPIEIPLGKGIVGTVAQTGIAEIVNDTTIDPRYIIDDQARHSEIAVPLISQNKVIGVIDSEHPEKDFFNEYHLGALKTIAAICASKIAQAIADEEAVKARKSQIEAEQIKQLDQMKSQFFTNVSHEFRTPLQLILGPLQKNQLTFPESEVEMMKRNALRLLRLVNQLLDLAKIEIGLLKPIYRYMEVYRFISEIAESFFYLAESKNIDYHINIPERDLVAYFDPDKLEKIVYNLISNSLKFTPPNGTVEVKLSASKERKLVLEVSDTGIGIPDELKERIFDRFFQVDGTKTRPHEGTGIGLALTKELVNLLQGTISIQNKDSRGCIFKVEIPFAERSEGNNGTASLLEEFPVVTELAKELGSNQNLEHSNNHKLPEELPLLLLVEDNNELRAYIKSELNHLYHIMEAENGEAGFSIAVEKIPDLIISDIMMPVMDGMDMLVQLRNDILTSHIPSHFTYGKRRWGYQDQRI
jgi:signal transduction histidine kinase